VQVRLLCAEMVQPSLASQHAGGVLYGQTKPPSLQPAPGGEDTCLRQYGGEHT
jgi:hypothetical protein